MAYLLFCSRTLRGWKLETALQAGAAQVGPSPGRACTGQVACGAAAAGEGAARPGGWADTA
eukprot:COSAG01_NODE_64803_length_275_cov_0.721591_2_plen_60_part_01